MPCVCACVIGVVLGRRVCAAWCLCACGSGCAVPRSLRSVLFPPAARCAACARASRAGCTACSGSRRLRSLDKVVSPREADLSSGRRGPRGLGKCAVAVCQCSFSRARWFALNSSGAGRAGGYIVFVASGSAGVCRVGVFAVCQCVCLRSLGSGCVALAVARVRLSFLSRRAV